MTLFMGLMLAAAAPAKKQSSTGILIFLVVIAAAGYFLLLRPQQQKAKKQREMMSEVGVGDEVLTAGGIVGRILEMDDDRFTILTGDNEEGTVEGVPTRLVMVRSAILRKIEAPVAPDESDHEEAELDHDGAGDAEPDAGHDAAHDAAHDDEDEAGGRAPGGKGS